jgi:flagellar assembly protein FliH
MSFPIKKNRTLFSSHCRRYRFPVLNQQRYNSEHVNVDQGTAYSNTLVVEEAGTAEHNTRAEIEQRIQQAREEGFSQGHSEGLSQGKEESAALGYQEGFEQAQQSVRSDCEEKLQQTLAPLEAIASRLECLEKTLLKEQQDMICDVITQVARQVVRAELSLNPAQIVKLTQEALKQFGDTASRIRIFINPEDLQHLADMGTKDVNGWDLESKEGIAPGDCCVDSDEAQMEVSSEQRLHVCVDQLRDYLGSME